MIENKMKITESDIDLMEVTASIACQFCSEETSVEIDQMSELSIKQQFINYLDEEGWKLIETEEIVGVACSECAENPLLSIGE